MASSRSKTRASFYIFKFLIHGLLPCRTRLSPTWLAGDGFVSSPPKIGHSSMKSRRPVRRAGHDKDEGEERAVSQSEDGHEVGLVLLADRHAVDPVDEDHPGSLHLLEPLLLFHDGSVADDEANLSASEASVVTFQEELQLLFRLMLALDIAAEHALEQDSEGGLEGAPVPHVEPRLVVR